MREIGNSNRFRELRENWASRTCFVVKRVKFDGRRRRYRVVAVVVVVVVMLVVVVVVVVVVAPGGRRSRPQNLMSTRVHRNK